MEQPKLNDYMKEWSEDSSFNISDLANEASKCMKLHSKYLNYFTSERLRLKKSEIERNELEFQVGEWIQGRLSKEELDALGWDIWIGPKILKPELDKYISSEKSIISKNLQVALQKERTEFLSSVLDQIKQRGYLVKSALDWQRFTSGA